jgi:heme-degrading monooxygenase HmoA
MIARTWHGVTDASKSDEYQATEGNLGVYVLRRIEGDKVHFLLLTLWESVEAIKKFAGAKMEKAKYYPADKESCLSYNQPSRTTK